MFQGPCYLKISLTHINEGGFIEAKLSVNSLNDEIIFHDETVKLWPNIECAFFPLKGIVDIGLTRVELPLHWRHMTEDRPQREMFEPEDLEKQPMTPDMM